MGERLLSVGIDVGTSTTQLIVSRLETENQAGTYSVPDYAITRREILYESPIYMTPLLSQRELDGPAIARIVEGEYRSAGVEPALVATGAIIITGETARKENAATVLESLKEFAGRFVVATAGPDLESVLAAKGSGAVAYSKATGKTLLHTDIGGGTSNMALIQKGQITATACLNVGGRLIRVEEGKISYLSPVLKGLTSLRVGQRAGEGELERLAALLVDALEKGTGCRGGQVPESLVTNHTMVLPPESVTFSFSGGVAELLDKEVEDPFVYGDLGPILAKYLRKSLLCAGDYYLGEQTIRATVIGAGCHSTQLSGSTVFGAGITLPLEDLPVLALEPGGDPPEVQVRRQKSRWQEGPVALYHPGLSNPGFQELQTMAQSLLPALGQLPRPWVVVTREDMAKALGQTLQSLCPGSLLCLDGLGLTPESYLEVGRPIGGGAAYPVIQKTLIFG